jgi:hypothetical protein
VGLVNFTGDGSIDDVSAIHASTESTDRLGTRSWRGSGTETGTETGTQKRRSSTAGALSTSSSSSSSHTLTPTLKDMSAGVSVACSPSVREGECGEEPMEKHRNLERRRDKEIVKDKEKDKEAEGLGLGSGSGPAGKKTAVPTRQTVKRASTRAQQDAKRKADMAIRSKR